MEIETITPATTEDYFALDFVSQSALKEIAKGAKAFKRALEPSEKKDYFTFGSAVDTLLTEPDEFSKRFFVGEIEFPSDNIKSIVDKVMEMNSYLNVPKKFSECELEITSGAQQIGYGQSWKVDTLINKVVEGGEAYYEFLIESNGKETLSKSAYYKVEKCVEYLITDKYTKQYFPTNNEMTKGVDYKYQAAIIWNYEHIQCKSLLDILIIDHNSKTIQPVDLKTTSMPTSDFEKGFLKFRYDFQAAFYMNALNTWKENHNYSDYTILEFKFIVVKSSADEAPMVFTCPDAVVTKAMTGFTTKTGYKYMGVEEAFAEYIWHEANEWSIEYSREYIENKGNINLKLNIE